MLPLGPQLIQVHATLWPLVHCSGHLHLLPAALFLSLEDGALLHPPAAPSGHRTHVPATHADPKLWVLAPLYEDHSCYATGACTPLLPLSRCSSCLCLYYCLFSASNWPRITLHLSQCFQAPPSLSPLPVSSRVSPHFSVTHLTFSGPQEFSCDD